MTIEQKYIDLINADIDGEISRPDKDTLDAFLLESDEARALYTELETFCESIESIEPESPPPHITHVIMNSVKPTPAKVQSTGFMQVLLATPALKYSATFAAGALLALTAITSDQFSNRALDDVTGLVGTISSPVNSELLNSVAVDNARVVGSVSLRNSGPMLILDFDLAADGPIDIEASYADQSVWFNGFGQLESSGTTISAKSGSVTLGMEGRRRYAVYFKNGKDRGVTIDLRFVVEGEVVHQASLSYEPAE